MAYRRENDGGAGGQHVLEGNLRRVRQSLPQTKAEELDPGKGQCRFRTFREGRGMINMMSQSGYLTSRETEIIRILRVLSEATDGFVVVGGYAVNAHGQHRFSEDCDLATTRDNVPVIDAILLGEGYELRRNEVRPPIGVTIREYSKSVGREPASLALLVDTVVSTTTRGTWTYKFIQDNSVEAIVAGATGSTPSRVAQRDLLVALKLHLCGTQDSGDLVMLSERVDWKTVAKCAACGSKEQL